MRTEQSATACVGSSYTKNLRVLKILVSGVFRREGAF